MTTHIVDIALPDDEPFIGYCCLCSKLTRITHAHILNYNDSTHMNPYCENCAVGGG